MGNLLKNLFAKKGDSFLGVDIGDSSIKVVQLKKVKGVVVLDTYGELALGPYANIEKGRATSLSSSDIAKALVTLIKESSINTNDCGVSIPLKSSLIFVMSLPNVSEKQLAQMIPIEARKYIPVPIAEVDLDWRVIHHEETKVSSFMSDDNSDDKPLGYESSGKKEKIDVLVVAIHKDTILKQKEIIEGAGLNLAFLEIEIFSTIRSVAGQNISVFSILDMGSSVSKLYIIEKGIIQDSHIIDRGSQDITLNISRSLGISVADAGEQKRKIGVEYSQPFEKEVSDIVSSNMEYILISANRILLNYQKKRKKSIDKLFITGGGAIAKGLTPFSASIVDVDIEIADPFGKIETPAFLDTLLKQVGPEFAVAIGLATRGLQQFKD